MTVGVPELIILFVILLLTVAPVVIIVLVVTIRSRTRQQVPPPGQPWPQQPWPPSGHAPGPPASLSDQLRDLAALRDQGILTDAEFEAQKARLLE